MEKTDKPLTRDALVSMQVIDAKGRLVGKVKDVAFAVGKMGIALTVENEDGEITKHCMGRNSSRIRLHNSKAPASPAKHLSTTTQQQTAAQASPTSINSQLNRFVQHAADP